MSETAENRRGDGIPADGESGSFRTYNADSEKLFESCSHFRFFPTMIDITDVMKGSYTEHHQIERYRMLIECYNAISFEYNTETDALGFDFWGRDGQQHIILVRDFLGNLPESRIISPVSRAAVSDAVNSIIGGKYRLSLDIQADIFGEGQRWWHASMVGISNGAGKVYSIVGLLQDIQEAYEKERIRSDLEAVLRRKAEIDELTGIYNKSTAQEKIKNLLPVRQPGTHSALMIIDIDNFKRINDSLGHFFGDSFLKEAAGVIKKCFREGDILGRFGGDEFVVFVAEHGDKRLVERKSRQILRGFNRIAVEGFDLISCSIGAVIIGSDTSDYDTAFMQADSALYESKRQGKNRFSIFSQNSTVLGVQKAANTAMDTAGRLTSDRDSLFAIIMNALLTSSNADEAVDRMLKAAVNSFRFSRAFICEHVQGGELRVTGSFCSPSLTAGERRLLSAPEHALPYLKELPERLKDCDFYYCRSSGCDGVSSYISCSIYDGRQLYGFLVFEQTVPERWLNQEQVENLCYVSGLMGLYLQKQRMKENFSNYSALDCASFESWATASLFVDFDSLTIKKVNRAAREIIDAAPGQCCRGALCPDGRPGDCERCVITAAAKGEHGRTQLINGMPANAEKVFFGGSFVISVLFEHFARNDFEV